MSILFVIFPLAMLVVAGALVAFIWAARSGQFDDLDTPAIRMLHDDEAAPGGAGSEADSASPESRGPVS